MKALNIRQGECGYIISESTGGNGYLGKEWGCSELVEVVMVLEGYFNPESKPQPQDEE